MFKSLLLQLFPSFKESNTQPNYFAFTQSQEKEQQISKEIINTISGNHGTITPPPLIDQSYLTTLFHHYLFGKHDIHKKNTQLSEFISARIKLALSKPKQLVECLPVLPLSVSTLLNELKNESFNTDVLIGVIEKEPTIAVKVIELANTAFYQRSNKEITDLKSAFMTMGSKGLMEGVINGFVSQFSPQSNVYYKQFGEKIWQHSLDNGNLTKALLNSAGQKEISGTGYLIGLILHLGHMIIFQLMMEAFAHIDPEAKPDADFFEKVINEYSVTLTYTLAKYWNLPVSVIENIGIQPKIKSVALLNKAKQSYPIAAAVYEGNFISMIETLFNNAQLTENEVKQLQLKLTCSEPAKQYLQEMIVKSHS